MCWNRAERTRFSRQTRPGPLDLRDERAIVDFSPALVHKAPFRAGTDQDGYRTFMTSCTIPATAAGETTRYAFRLTPHASCQDRTVSVRSHLATDILEPVPRSHVSIFSSAFASGAGIAVVLGVSGGGAKERRARQGLAGASRCRRSSTYCQTRSETQTSAPLRRQSGAQPLGLRKQSGVIDGSPARVHTVLFRIEIDRDG